MKTFKTLWLIGLYHRDDSHNRGQCDVSAPPSTDVVVCVLVAHMLMLEYACMYSYVFTCVCVCVRVF